MKIQTKVLTSLVSVVSLLINFLGIAACATPSETGDAQIRAIYEQYVAHAEANDETPLTYEEWLETIKGDKGDKGDQGEPGTPGAPGQQGDPGKSAYEIYLESLGDDVPLSEAEWLATLAGKPGTGIVSVEYATDGDYLIVTYTDGKTSNIALPDKFTHEHSYNGAVVTLIPATFAADGIGYKTCECGYTELVVIPKVEFTIADAVEAAKFNRSQVRKGTGLTSSDFNTFEASTFFYEFGNNYSHIVNNDDNEESWYTLKEDGELFAVVLDYATGNYTIDVTGNKGYLNGFSFQIGRASGGRRYYGAEDLFKGVYEWGATNANGDFKQSIAPYGLTLRGEFSFGNLGSSDYFCKIEVSFELSPERALKHIVLHSYAYSRRDCTINTETNTATLKPNAKLLYDEYIEFTQTLLSELSPEEVENVPICPYTKTSINN